MPTKTRSTIGQNPLDAVVPDLQRQATGATENKRPNTAPVIPAPESDRKERLTIHLSQNLIERLKNAVFWTPGLTLAELGENAFTQLVDELETKHGGAFEPRTGELKGGRPLKRP